MFKAHAWKMLAAVMGAVMTGVVSLIVGYQLAADQAKAENAPRYVDYIVGRDGFWTTTSPVDEVTFVYRDAKGRLVDGLNRITTDLYNFGPRDLPEFDLQLDATFRDGTLPRLLGRPLVSIGGSEDFDAEQNVKRFVRGNTLSMVFHFSGLNQSDVLTPSRKLVLYFAGKEAPNIFVSARGKGVQERQEVYKQYNERQLAKRSWYERNSTAVISVGYGLVLALILIVVTASGRARERRQYRAMPAAIAQTLERLHPHIISQRREVTAREATLAVWERLYSLMDRFNRRLSVKPNRELLFPENSTICRPTGAAAMSSDVSRAPIDASSSPPS